MVFSPKLVARYQELKEQVPDCLLLMQVGTFMQVMDEDARIASEVTGLKLQMAGEVDAPVVLGGFPKSGLDAYTGKLVRAGHNEEEPIMARQVITTLTYIALIGGIVLGLSSAALQLGSGQVRAATGNIDPTHKWAWGGNVGWVNFAPAHGGVTVYADHLEGYAWSENIGWIRLGSHTGGGTHSYGNASATDYGVNYDGAGNLSGYAWSTNAGWINFNPSHGQVTIDPNSGSFDGYAWAENIGWIHFKGTGAVAYNVVTHWGQGSTLYLPLILKNSGPSP